MEGRNVSAQISHIGLLLKKKGLVLWDADYVSAYGALYDGNTVFATIDMNRCVQATKGRDSGKFYFECLVETFTVHNVAVGLGNRDILKHEALETQLGEELGEYAYTTRGRFYIDGVTYSGVAAAYGAGSVVGVAADMTARKIWFSLNGVWQAAGNPENGTNPAATYASPKMLYPSAQSSSGARMKGIFKNFTYTPPTGFKGWE